MKIILSSGLKLETLTIDGREVEAPYTDTLVVDLDELEPGDQINLKDFEVMEIYRELH